MRDFGTPGLSVAFALRGEIVFRAAYGFADEAAREPLTPEHTFRIASISKPLTAVAVFLLIEQGKLGLNDKIFGPEGHWPHRTEAEISRHMAGVTLHHLLTHTSGGWGNDRDDPMFQHPELSHADLIARTLRDHPLKHEPGTTYAYSNFGYCLLGRIIEKVADKTYSEFIQEAVFERCAIRDMRIGGNTLEDRAPGEVVYHGHQGENPYAMNVRRMDSHGGWTANATELVKFLTQTGAITGKPKLLRETSLKSMYRATKANAGYASGWAVNETPNRWHSGSLPGTSTIAVSTASGLSWAGLANNRSPGIATAMDRLMWDIAKTVPAWRA